MGERGGGGVNKSLNGGGQVFIYSPRVLIPIEIELTYHNHMALSKSMIPYSRSLMLAITYYNLSYRKTPAQRQR